jgi:hypothetical protein
VAEGAGPGAGLGQGTKTPGKSYRFFIRESSALIFCCMRCTGLTGQKHQKTYQTYFFTFWISFLLSWE